ncbi:cupin domain-containing protein [Streptomyces sp. NBC_01231]|nr:cupin domain-containing protein [Streptomyces sp. NBC_01231]
MREAERQGIVHGAESDPARKGKAPTPTCQPVQRHDEGEWGDGANWSERLLDETYGSGYVRTLVLRLERAGKAPESVAPHAAGTLHHVYVITGKLRTGPLTEPVDLAVGDFVRFPGDVPHRHVCLSERVVAHVVTTLPQVRQFGPTITKGMATASGGAVSDTAPRRAGGSATRPGPHPSIT